MKLTFLGAAHEVTGSRFLLEACDKRMMIDYGMEQGADIYENTPLPVAPGMIDFVFVTHAHIDHTGYLPLLGKQGFQGKIYATEATADLCRIMLMDSAHIQESDAEWKNRKAQRSGRPLVEPLYTQQDATAVCNLFVPCRYHQQIEVCPGISIRMIDVGHLLGSAAIEMRVTENGKTETLVFSGDIGNLRQPLLRDPETLTAADYVIMESTYGDRSHGERPDYLSALTRVLQETFDRGGNVVIPSFAVGRTQEMLYFIRQIKQEKRVQGHDGFPVYVDSPLAIEATNVFKENTYECADEETLALLKQGINPISFDGLRVTVSAEESKLINEDKTPKVILSASGMCDAGRIRHHLKHNLWRRESTVLFVGYQSTGTLGRSLVEGVKEVRLFGEPIDVHASIEKLAGVSGHADNQGLMRWIGSFEGPVKRVFVVHGEDGVTELFATRLRDELHFTATAPYNGECWDLTENRMLTAGNHEKLTRPAHEAAAMEAAPKSTPPSHMPKPVPQKTGENGAYERLVVAGERLMSLIRQMQNVGSKQQGELAEQMHALWKQYEDHR